MTDPTVLAPQRLCAEYKRLFDVQDIDGLRELRAEGCTLIDHRSGPFVGYTGQLPPPVASFDTRIELIELLACDERAIAMLAAVRGTAPDTGAFEVAFGAVDVVEDGRYVRIELFDPDDPDAILARYSDLAEAAAQP
ncbi:MAG TPA: hypothetical protein VMF09_11665 [Solirubrobacteraceae bacterium]|nr:hypothetical protein [Solirubrobacteraceae bacterium]